ncbi:hypothetical protein [Herbidospora mongoliensis]|uniref:hypothetical protein n=1 Tax=Herbidospora mongoliensis TaxID=688067 RepID=UPI00082D2285|nr:hypothetical protein [Herbidospora mongoliensis]
MFIELRFSAPHSGHMVTSYREVVDRIYSLARLHALSVRWRETTSGSRLLLLYDGTEVVVGRSIVPIRNITRAALDDVEHDLEHVFGRGWLR